MKISTKLILILLSAVIAVMAVYALVTVSRTQDRLSEELLKMGEHVSMALSVGILHHLENGDLDGVREVVETASAYEDIVGLAVFDRQGALIAASASIADELQDERQVYTAPAGTGRYEGKRTGRRIFTYRMGIRDKEGEMLGSLRLVLGDKSLLPYVIEARNHILVAIGVMTGVLVALIVYFSQTQIADPLRVLTEGAREIGQGNLKSRIDVRGGKEVAALAEAFNGMATSLEASTEEIIREREYIRNIVDSLNEGIIVVDHRERVTAWNQTMERRYGLALEKVLGKRLEELFPDLYTPDFSAAISRLLKGDIPQLSMDRVALKAAPERILGLIGSPLRDTHGQNHGAVLVLADITERLQLEQQIQQSEKLAAVGQLAAGVAHEIGTPLNVISGSAEYLLGEVGTGEEEELKTIVAEVERISALVKQLLTFARQEAPQVEGVDTGELIDSIMVLMRRQIEKQGIRIEIELDPRLPAVSGDRNQIQQVLLNLIMNAWQAMPEGGKLVLRGECRPEGEGEEDGQDGKRWVALQVEDTGTGIAAVHLEKIFEPFFTTKEVGQGTGLGLAIAQRIVANHGGRIGVASREGEGTAFTVFLPVYSEEHGNG